MSTEQQDTFDVAQRYLLDNLATEDKGDQVGLELFELADLLKGQPALLRALTDPGRSIADRQALAKSILSGKVSDITAGLVELLAGRHWAKPVRFINTLEDMGVQAILDGARRSGVLQQVEDELFAINQLAGAERELRVQLSDIGGADDSERQRIADTLLKDRVLAPTLTLVKRAVHISGRGRIMATLRDYATKAALAHDAQLVTVATASPMTDEQLARLKSIIERQVGGEVSLAVSVDPDLIGGFRINYGDEAADSSVRSELWSAQRALTK